MLFPDPAGPVTNHMWRSLGWAADAGAHPLTMLPPAAGGSRLAVVVVNVFIDAGTGVDTTGVCALIVITLAAELARRTPKYTCALLLNRVVLYCFAWRWGFCWCKSKPHAAPAGGAKRHQTMRRRNCGLQSRANESTDVAAPQEQGRAGKNGNGNACDISQPRNRASKYGAVGWTPPWLRHDLYTTAAHRTRLYYDIDEVKK